MLFLASNCQSVFIFSFQSADKKPLSANQAQNFKNQYVAKSIFLVVSVLVVMSETYSVFLRKSARNCPPRKR
jgi:hypothetical protein